MKSTDFVYASTRVRASQGTLSHEERLAKAADCASYEALCSYVRSLLPQDRAFSEDLTLDELCDAYFASAVALVRESSPDVKVCDSLLYKYDAANLKLCLKASVSDTDIPPMFPYGTVQVSDIPKAVESGDYSVFTQALAQAAKDALEDYSVKREAMAIDLIIDKACFADMSKRAVESDVHLLRSLCETDADIANITACLRIGKMSLSLAVKREIFDRSFVPGGKLKESCFSGDVFTLEKLRPNLMGTPYSEILHSISDEDFVAQAENALSKIKTKMLSQIKFTPFGAEVLCGYIVERELEARAFMTVGACIKKGTPSAEIRGILLG